MKRYPALACLLITMPMMLIAHLAVDTGAPTGFLRWAGLFSLGIGLLGAALQRYRNARWLLACAIACQLVSYDRTHRLYGTTAMPDVEEPARLQGTLTDVRNATGGVRLMVQGEIDRVDLPACMAMSVVMVWKPRQTFVQGQRVILYARMRRPHTLLLRGAFDETRACMGRGASFTGDAYGDAVWVDADPDVLDMFFHDARHAIRRVIDRAVTPLTAAVLHALVLGDASHIERTDRALYAASGTVHMFSVSGSHVALVISIVWGGMAAIGRRRVRFTGCVLMVVFYVVLTGGSAAAWRAAIMGLVALAGYVAERPTYGINSMAITVLLMLCARPSLLHDAGFHCSVAATLGILVAAPAIVQATALLLPRRNTIYRHVIPILSVSLAASAFVVVPAAAWFGTISLVSPLANILVVPMLSAAMMCGLLLVSVGVVVPFTSAPIAWCCEVLVYMAHGAAMTFGALNPGVDILWGCVSAVLLLLVTITARSWRSMAIRTACAIAVGFMPERSSRSQTPAVQMFPYVVGVGRTQARQRADVLLLHGRGRTRVIVCTHDLPPARLPSALRRQLGAGMPADAVTLYCVTMYYPAFLPPGYAGGVVTGPDAHAARHEFAQVCALSEDSIRTVTQVHGDVVVDADTMPDTAEGSVSVQADGLYAVQRERILAVRVADCAGLLLVDPVTKSYAAVHSGWRGTRAAIVSRAIEHLVATYGACAANMHVWISPCASGARYEVKEDVARYFPHHVVPVSGSDDTWLFDNVQAITAQCLAAGIVPSSIVASGICTIGDLRFPSYRRDGKMAGRAYVFIARVDSRDTIA